MSHLTDHFSIMEFLEQIAVASGAANLTNNDLQFLADIESKFDQYGERMYFSHAQAEYLASLAERDEDDDEAFDGDDCLGIIPAERFRKRSRAKGAA